jgi:hypothetical protein
LALYADRHDQLRLRVTHDDANSDHHRDTDSVVYPEPYAHDYKHLYPFKHKDRHADDNFYPYGYFYLDAFPHVDLV